MPKVKDLPKEQPYSSFGLSRSVVTIVFIAGLLGAVVGVGVLKLIPESPNGLIKDFYEDEMAVLVSPTTLRRMIGQKDKNYILVDLRSKTEYDKEHIVTAVNIPATSMNAEQIVAAFKRLPANKQVIVHCYSASCTLGRKVGKLLAEHGIFVKELDIGWSEWKYFWDLWNPGAKPDAGGAYIATGSANSAGQPIVPCTAGEFGC